MARQHKLARVDTIVPRELWQVVIASRHGGIIVGRYCRRWLAQELADQLDAAYRQAHAKNAELEAADKKP